MATVHMQLQRQWILIITGFNMGKALVAGEVLIRGTFLEGLTLAIH